jgi:hypothetical protein
MAKTSNLRDQWALRGAEARLREINDEIQTIYAEFPELKGSRQGLEPKRTMSAEARTRMSAGMRKYWARRKAATKTAAKTKTT